MSFGKSSTNSKSSSNSTQNQNYNQTGTGTQTETPNNLPFIQQGWDAVSKLLQGTSGNAVNTANQGIDLTTQAGQKAAVASASGLDAISALVGNGSANGANAYLTPIANGSQIGVANPGFQQILAQIAQGAQAATDGGFGASGRYGSGANANAFNGAVTNTAGQLGYQNYKDSQDRQMTAAQTLSQNNTSSANQVLAALGLIPNVAGAGTDAGAAVAAAGAAPVSLFSQIMAALGNGGGTTNLNQSQAGTSAGTAAGTGTGSSTTTDFKVAPKFSFGPFSFGG